MQDTMMLSILLEQRKGDLLAQASLPTTTRSPQTTYWFPESHAFLSYLDDFLVHRILLDSTT